MKKNFVMVALWLGVAGLLSACSSTVAPQINPVPYYTYYPASLAMVESATERALPAAGMHFTGSKTVNAQTVELRGYTSGGDAILITLHSVGTSVTKFEARIGLYGHLRDVQDIEHWVGKYVGQAISAPAA
ncbi:hypothetical protein [Acidithiobacillus acidisediminis]|uniref:hypothetical protein n=1 Tax=Acidithiobacillus TaxID=119977 RepID=UPI00201083D7|nr:hypothetical protein [Acidithiobacillus sp. S30A2]